MKEWLEELLWKSVADIEKMYHYQQICAPENQI